MYQAERLYDCKNCCLMQKGYFWPSLPFSLSPEQPYSCEPMPLSWPRWRVTSSAPASSQWRPWGNVWGAVIWGARWGAGARQRTGRCHRSARGWWLADALPVTGYHHRRSPQIPLKSRWRQVKMYKRLSLVFGQMWDLTRIRFDLFERQKINRKKIFNCALLCCGGVHMLSISNVPPTF